MTIIDGLTQAHVKRYLLEALEKEIIRARRHARDLSFFMFDIDHFKKINDDHGHLAGDFVLKELARIVQGRIRRDEVFARYGGEEFAIILPETNLEGARALADGLREKIETSRFVFQGEQIRVTISIGVAMLADTDRDDASISSSAPTTKLYEAKRGGRNTSSADVRASFPTIVVPPPGPRSRELAARLAARRVARVRRASRRARERAARSRRRSSTRAARARTSSTSTAIATSISSRASARSRSATAPNACARARGADEAAGARARRRVRVGREGRARASASPRSTPSRARA